MGNAGLKLTELSEATETISIETPEQLQVFSPEHPLPLHAARDTPAVAAAFEQLISARGTK